MDFTISPELADLRDRDRGLRRGACPAARGRPRGLGRAREHRDPGARRAARQGAGGGALVPPADARDRAGRASARSGMAVCYEAMNRSIFGPVVFNSAAPDDGNMMVLEALGTPAQKERWLQPDRRRAGALRLRHDRAASRRRLRPVDDADARPTRDGRRLRRARPQVVHHRRGGGRAFHPDRPHLGRSAPRADGLPVPPRPARLAHRPPHPDHGAGGAWRPLRARVRRPAQSRGERAPGGGPGPQGDADPARPGAPHPLHALARARQALRRDRAGVCGPARGLRRAARRSRERAADARRPRHADRDRPAARDEGRVGARPRRLRAEGGVHGQDPCRQPAAPGGRHRHPDQRRARLFEGHGARMDLPLRPPGAAGRRGGRGPQDGAEPASRGAGARPSGPGRPRGDGGQRRGTDRLRSAGSRSCWRRNSAPSGGVFRLERIGGGPVEPDLLRRLAARAASCCASSPPGRSCTGAHAVDREYRVLEALAPTDVPVPRAGPVPRRSARRSARHST